MFVLSEAIRSIKASWTTESIPHKLKKVSFFNLGYGSCVFCFLIIHLIFLFYLPSLHMHLWTEHISLNFLPSWFSVCGKPHNLALIAYHFRGSNKRQCVFALPN